MKADLRVLYLAAEAEPFVKVGGLGDVAGSLPQALRALPPNLVSDWYRTDVRLVIPLHGMIDRAAFHLEPVASFTVFHASGPLCADALYTEVNGLPVYLIGGPDIPENAQVYSTDASIDGHKFTFFSLAAIELARALNWVPHIIHANDWHTSPAVYALGLDREGGSFYSNTVTVLSVHNLPYLGVGAGEAMISFGLPPAAQSDLPWWAQSMPLPLGLLTADQIIAPSPAYASEIQTQEFGAGLKEFLSARQSKISGILNGINVERWDPAKDPALAANYDAESLSMRQLNKTALQNQFLLEADPEVPLLAIVSRMDPQKGVDLAPDALEMLASRPWQAIILGTGIQSLEATASRLEARYPDRVRAVIRFDPQLSSRVYAGADALLIPSRYEPSGLTQMIAMRYGCVPVARATGGLRDTITDFDGAADGTGFLFAAATAEDLAAAVGRALDVYPDRQAWTGLQLRGMARDFSWERSAREYLDLYTSLVRARRAIKLE